MHALVQSADSSRRCHAGKVNMSACKCSRTFAGRGASDVQAVGSSQLPVNRQPEPSRVSRQFCSVASCELMRIPCNFGPAEIPQALDQSQWCVTHTHRLLVNSHHQFLAFRFRTDKKLNRNNREQLRHGLCRSEDPTGRSPRRAKIKNVRSVCGWNQTVECHESMCCQTQTFGLFVQKQLPKLEFVLIHGSY